MYERKLFSGVERAGELPRGYERLQKRHGADVTDVSSFEDVLETMEGRWDVEWRDLLYERDEVAPGDGLGIEEVHHYKALVNPAWEGRDPGSIPGSREDAVWHIPTNKYTRVPHHEALQHAAEALVERGDGPNVFGAMRARREGGEVHLDIFFEDTGVRSLSDGSDDAIIGISTGHDYYGNVRLYVDFIAYHDTGDGVGQVMRYLVDPRRRKHVGGAGDVIVAWYDESFGRLDRISDRLYGKVADAMHYEVPLKEMPCSIQGFYEHLGLPNNAPSVLAEPASNRAVKTAVGPYSAWHLYKAGMWAIEHHYEARDTSAFKKHVSTVNTLLFNPALAERRALSSIEATLKDRPDDHEIHDFIDDDDPAGTLDSVRTRMKSISEGVEEFRSTSDRLKALLNDEGTAEAEPVEEPEEAEAE